jgi:hypothetical protein
MPPRERDVEASPFEEIINHYHQQGLETETEFEPGLRVAEARKRQVSRIKDSQGSSIETVAGLETTFSGTTTAKTTRMAPRELAMSTS